MKNDKYFPKLSAKNVIKMNNIMSGKTAPFCLLCRFLLSTGIWARSGSWPWSLQRGGRSTTGTTWRNTASMSTRYCLLLRPLSVWRSHKLIVYWLIIPLLSHTPPHAHIPTTCLHSSCSENSMLAAAASVLHLHKMHSGTVLIVGHPSFGGAQSTISVVLRVKLKRNKLGSAQTCSRSHLNKARLCRQLYCLK